MKCAQVKNLLADYLDKELSARDMARAKEHISTCPECRRELEFLKSYRSYAATLKKVKAPDNLLENIHKRIEGSAARNGWIKKIFFPLKTRLPMEVAGACALALIAFFIFYPFSPEKTEYRGMAPRQEAAREPETLDESSSISRQKPAQTPVTRGATEGRRAPAKEAPYAMEHRVASTESARAARRENENQGPIAEETNVRPKTGEISIYLARVTPEEKGPEPQASDSEKIHKQEEKAGAPMDYSADQLSKDKKIDRDIKLSYGRQGPSDAAVEDMVRSVGGSVIERVYGNKLKYRGQITVEIPASNFGAFIEKISAVWKIRQRAPEKLPGNITRVRIYLLFER
jgi:anti-sigma factor RsiW